MLEPVNGHNKRLFYCQNHQVRKHGAGFTETFNHKTQAGQDVTLYAKKKATEM